MARPAKPAVGTNPTAAFAAALVDYASEAMEFIRLPVTGATWDLNDTAGTGAWAELQLTRLPINTDGRILYALVGTMIRATTAGANVALLVKRNSTTTGLDGIAYCYGTANRGGMSGPFMCRLGGANGRSIWWTAGTSSSNWITVYGYWRLV